MLSFSCVKKPVCSAPEKPFKVQIDANDIGAGAVFLHEGEGGTGHPVCFFSRKFNHHQLNYLIIEKETFALIWALKFFKVYVGPSLPVTVFTDHNILTFLSSMHNTNHRLMRWLMFFGKCFFQPYALDICHFKGKENVMARGCMIVFLLASVSLFFRPSSNSEPPTSLRDCPHLI